MVEAESEGCASKVQEGNTSHDTQMATRSFETGKEIDSPSPHHPHTAIKGANPANILTS